MGTTIFGAEGERLARSYLENKGYHFITRNFRRAHGEIDLIMDDEGTLVFVEVKSRHNRRYGDPIEAVGYTKQKHIRYCANVFIREKRIEDRRIRFDVVEILISPYGEAKFRHTRNAF